MAEAKRIPGPTEVGKGEYKPQSTMTPEQQADAAKKHKAAKERAMGQRGKRYQPPPNVAPERLGGGLTEAEMNVEAPLRQQARPKADVRLKQEKPKKYAAPKAQLGRKGPGQMQREGTVDVKTGKPKPTKTYGERAISYLEGLGTKVAPPGSVTRLRETGARPPRTMDERLGSIRRTASRTFPGKATRPGGILDIPALAGETKGPSLKAQKGTPEAAKRRAAMSLAEKKRRGLRVTGADVPGHGKAKTRGEGIPEIKRVGEAGLGEFVGRGIKPPPPPVAKRRPTRKKKVAAKKVPWYMRAAKAFKEAGAEALSQAQTDKRPSGKYGTKEQARKIKAGAKKAVVPKKFKEKK